MIFLLLVLSLLINTFHLKLVIPHDEVEKYSMDRVISEAELIGSETVPHETCPNVDELLEKYRFYVRNEDGSESEEEAVIKSVKDITYDTNKIINMNEHWIYSNIYIRFHLSNQSHPWFKYLCFRPYLNCFHQEDPFLITELKNNNLIPPPTEPYNWTVNDIEPLLYGQYGQPVYIDQVIFKGQVENGFFIEAGAHDFETNSDTLYYELEHGWTGLLVEAHPLSYQLGSEKNRRVRSVRTCLSTSGGVETMNFDLSGSVRNETTREAMAGLVKEANKDTIQMQCFPLYTLLLALGNPTVHYFSLDIEGAEFPVLTSIPWDKVHSSA